MQLDIVSPDKNIYSGEATAVLFPGVEGSFGVLDNHAPMIATLKKGVIKITKEGNTEEVVEVSGGVVEVLKNKVIVLAE
ncbi:ATP synthase F1 subunit epsilon [bacterium]|jgi:F-type H+-transporting ATPase subunit epsilon|nr:ATP synthase F1 subunit epsilon [bacterium]|tara:strand:- start:50 stop:286 length:237 start_codon:yes stop_codon:yes gene_type:complete